MSLREELIRVAAVAVAIMEDLAYGKAIGGLTMLRVLQQVEAERRKQNATWGEPHHTPEEWLAILAEEVGGAAGEVPLKLALRPEDDNGNVVIQHMRKGEVLARVFLKERFGA